MLCAIRQPSGLVLAEGVKDAKSYFARALGWIGRKRIGKDDGLLFRRAGSIHTCLMRIPIDVVYLDSNDKVLAIRTALKPWRIALRRRHTRHILELAAHAADGLKPGEHLVFMEKTPCTK